MDKEQLEVIEEKPMGDNDIRTYFPNAKIKLYNELNDMNHIDELLPDNKDYAFILIEDSPNKGHWVCIDKLKDEINFFDSYGGAPDSQLKWTPMEQREELGQGEKKLTQLLKGSGYKVNYNPVKYQEVSSDIQTCGRHCCMRVKQMLDGKDFDDYLKFMNESKKSTGMNYDEVVSFFIRR
jgi:hypothetical protein